MFYTFFLLEDIDINAPIHRNASAFGGLCHRDPLSGLDPNIAPGPHWYFRPQIPDSVPPSQCPPPCVNRKYATYVTTIKCANCTQV